MNYGYTQLATDWNERDTKGIGVRWLKAVLFFLPRANPDQEKLYPFVAKWLLEIDENGVPLREIGVDKNNAPLFAAPNDRNMGFWTDCNKTFELDELENSTAETFEALWQRITCNDA